MPVQPLLKNIQGIASADVAGLRQRYGKNIFDPGSSHRFLRLVLDIVKEPMFILLLVGCSLYFILGQLSEGFLMLAAMGIVTAIALYQEVKSSNAVNALKVFTVAKVTVIRDHTEILVAAEELVPGDIILLEEGMNVPADAILLQQNDLSVNESVITGESLPVAKETSGETVLLFQGTTINSGKCIARVSATGNQTVLGKLGKTVGEYQATRTLLQIQLNRFVRLFALFGLLGFAIIFLMNYLHYQEWTTSLLFALTLAMSAIPEEIPVAFSSFMALGAFKMSRSGIITKQPQVVENLGAVTVFCFDKTGTLTENKMQVRAIYVHNEDALIELSASTPLIHNRLLRYAVLASEKDPFDSMEKAIWESFYTHTKKEEADIPTMVHEYPLEGRPPMMTHVYGNEEQKTVAAKGAAERILNVCKLEEPTRVKVQGYIHSLASEGYRVLGVASAEQPGTDYPVNQDDFNWQFEGLLALYDPPRKNVPAVLQQFYGAKIDVKLITGDHPETAMNIARQTGILDPDSFLTGDQVSAMTPVALQQAVQKTTVFARMFPDAKLKVIEALKANQEIVAMTGDGVNDGPALKAAQIGIAMGKKGTEIARQAADLILTDDNLEKLVVAVSEGRKIYGNLKKAIRYIISIHIPIILIASLPLLLGWVYPNIFTPIHIIFLELIMGPTCSIFFEREPVEGNMMLLPPRSRTSSIFTRKELLTSMVQGLVIATGVLSLYYYYMNKGASTEETRTMVFTTLIISNVFLTFVNRSFTATIDRTSRYKNKLALVLLLVSIFFLASLHLIPFVRELFYLSAIPVSQLLICLATGFASVCWFEVYKFLRYK